MKNTTAFFLIVSILLSACTSRQGEELLPELLQAEALMYTHPDSAWTILNKMQRPSRSDKLQYATWCLLTTQAQDKNYIDHTSDSLINVAYDYFMKQDDPHRKALVLNYEGRVNEDLQEAIEATQFYLQARDMASQTGDYKLRFLIESNMGILYLYRSLYPQAEQAIKDAYTYAVEAKDSTYISSALSLFGRLYSVTEKMEASVAVYKEAAQLAEQMGDDRSLSRAFGELAAVYREMSESDSSLKYLKRAEFIDKKNAYEEISQTYLGVGDTYVNLGQYDSALFYINKSLETTNIYTKRAAYMILYQLHEKQKRYEKAIVCNNQYWNYTDSVELLKRSKDIAEIQMKYDHEKLKNRNNQLAIEKSNLIKITLLTVIVLLCVITYLVYKSQRKLLLREQDIQNKKEQLHLNIVELNENQAIIEQNEELIRDLSIQVHENVGLQEDQQTEIEAISKENDKLKEQTIFLQGKITTYICSLSEKDKIIDTYQVLSIENTRLQEREIYLCSKLLKYIDVLNLIKTQPYYIDTKEQWGEIINAINIVYDNYVERLSANFPALSESDFQYCCLIKLRLGNASMATLMSIDPSTATKRKQRLKERINQSLSSPLTREQSVEAFLWSY